jgi:hypothetical protein
MPVIHVEAQISPDELLAAAGQLSLSDMDKFLAKLLVLHAKQRAPSLPAEEFELLEAINRGIPAEMHERQEELVGRQRAGTLTADEYTELLHLTDRIEVADAERLSQLCSLARLRGVSLDALLESLGIRAPEYV